MDLSKVGGVVGSGLDSSVQGAKTVAIATGAAATTFVGGIRAELQRKAAARAGATALVVAEAPVAPLAPVMDMAKLCAPVPAPKAPSAMDMSKLCAPTPAPTKVGDFTHVKWG